MEHIVISKLSRNFKEERLEASIKRLKWQNEFLDDCVKLMLVVTVVHVWIRAWLWILGQEEDMDITNEIKNFEDIMADWKKYQRIQKEIEGYDMVIKHPGLNPNIKREAFIARSKLSIILNNLKGLYKS